MQISVVTLFPDLVAAVGQHGIVAQAIDKGLLSLDTWNPRDFSQDKQRRVDARPYGGGAGMLMTPQPLCDCLDRVKQDNLGAVLYLTPQGQRLQQSMLHALAAEAAVVLVAGRYEGVDARFIDSRVDQEISIGDYVLAGGELAAMVVVEGIARLLPCALGNRDSAAQDSFSDGLLEHPHYTRPEVFQGLTVPPLLLRGDHEQIRLWRLQQSLKRTRSRRPDLLARLELNTEQIQLLNALYVEQENEQDH